jgi:dipeptidyl aminopeptidase/acylaminoacyl peptidase
MSLMRVNLRTGAWDTLRESSTVGVPADYISPAQTIEFPSNDGRPAYALYYPPRNPDYHAPEGALPPLLTLSHGGPTGAASGALDMSVQFWTTRGFAVVDVNYGGSVGYGRAYRQLLNGNWGVVDVDDCANAALHLVHQHLADGSRLAIRGGSAGGYTTLAALAFRNVFAAGASYYGVSDLTALAEDTHKFESRYLDRLVGPYPESAETYRSRSPINHTEGFSCPIILFQGLEDQIVPPNQAEIMYAAVRYKGILCAYLPFEGEQHGFRRAENIKRALEAELYFYSRVFGFDLPDPVEPVQIENL